MNKSLFLIGVILVAAAVSLEGLQVAEEGEDFVLRCGAEPEAGESITAMYWSREPDFPNTINFVQEDRFSLTSDYGLEIDDVEASDAGNYICSYFQSANGANYGKFDWKTVTLQVN